MERKYKDVKLIRCCPDHDFKLIWRQQGHDIVSLTAICATMWLIFFVWSYPTRCVASLCDGPVSYISYSMYTVNGLCSFCKERFPIERLIY